MILHKFHKDILHCDDKEQVFKYLLDTLKPSIILWSYFVNWDKVLRNTARIELALNELNFLIGKDDFDSAFRFLIKENSKVLMAIPALVVRRKMNSPRFTILVDYKNKRLTYEEYDFSKNDPTVEDIEKYLTFIKETGLKDLLASKKLKNLVDYMIGVEAGLDSNGRKNRGGFAMENIVEVFVADACQKLGLRYLKEANADMIRMKWGYEVPVDKSSRRYDFVVETKEGEHRPLVVIEANFYGGGGSKLKATAGEYRNLYDTLDGKYRFVWITDGMGWKTTTRPLEETFNHNDEILNLDMLEKGALEYILK